MDNLDDQDLRVPPHNLHAEQSVLGGLMQDNAAWDRIAGQLDAGDFYQVEHRLLWNAIAALADADKPFDVVTLARRLESDGALDAAGGLAYLGTLVRETPSTANIRAYAEIVRERSGMRALIAFGAAQVDAGYSPEGQTSDELIASAQDALASMADRRRSGGGFLEPKSMARDALDAIESALRRGTGMVGIPTGWKDLDAQTRGLEPGSLVVLAARPSMGKTTLGMQMALHAGQSTDKPVAVFSLEMPASQLAMRAFATLGRIDFDALRTGNLADEQWRTLTSASARFSTSGLRIDDRSCLSASDIAARAKALHREHGGLSMILIDYLGLIDLGARVESQNIGIGKVTRRLKGLAKDLNVPVVLLSQLNRNLEQRPNKRPQLSDLRDSGSIEQDADVVLFIYRDEVYNPDSDDKGTAELIVAKQRNGPIGTVRLAYAGRYCRFDDLATWEPPPRTQAKAAIGDYDDEY